MAFSSDINWQFQDLYEKFQCACRINGKQSATSKFDPHQDFSKELLKESLEKGWEGYLFSSFISQLFDNQKSDIKKRITEVLASVLLKHNYPSTNAVLAALKEAPRDNHGFGRDKVHKILLGLAETCDTELLRLFWGFLKHCEGKAISIFYETPDVVTDDSIEKAKDEAIKRLSEKIQEISAFMVKSESFASDCELFGLSIPEFVEESSSTENFFKVLKTKKVWIMMGLVAFISLILYSVHEKVRHQSDEFVLSQQIELENVRDLANDHQYQSAIALSLKALGGESPEFNQDFVNVIKSAIGKPIKAKQFFVGKDTVIEDVSDNGLRLLARSGNEITLWDIPSEELISKYSFNAPFSSIKFSHDSATASILPSDDRGVVIDAVTGLTIDTLDAPYSKIFKVGKDLVLAQNDNNDVFSVSKYRSQLLLKDVRDFWYIKDSSSIIVLKADTLELIPIENNRLAIKERTSSVLPNRNSTYLMSQGAETMIEVHCMRGESIGCIKSQFSIYRFNKENLSNNNIQLSRVATHDFSNINASNLILSDNGGYFAIVDYGRLYIYDSNGSMVRSIEKGAEKETGYSIMNASLSSENEKFLVDAETSIFYGSARSGEISTQIPSLKRVEKFIGFIGHTEYFRLIDRGTFQLWKPLEIPSAMQIRLNNANISISPALSPTSKILASADNKKLQLWDTESGKLVHKSDEFSAPILSLAYDNSGQQLLVNLQGDKAFIVNGLNGKVKTMLNGCESADILFSNLNNHLLCMNSDAFFELTLPNTFNDKNNQFSWKAIENTRQGVASLWQRYNRQLWRNSWYSIFIDFYRAKSRPPLPPTPPTIIRPELNTEDETLLIGRENLKDNIDTDVSLATSLRPFLEEYDVTDMPWQTELNLSVIEDTENSSSVLTITKDGRSAYAKSISFKSPIFDIQFSPDGHFMTVKAESFTVFDTQTWEARVSGKHSEFSKWQISTDEKYLLAVSSDNHIKIYNLATGEVFFNFQLPHIDIVDIQISADSRYIFWMQSDGLIHVKKIEAFTEQHFLEYIRQMSSNFDKT